MPTLSRFRELPVRRLGSLAAIAAGVLLGATACGTPESSSDQHLDRADALVMVEEARLGDFDDPDEGFSWVVDMDVDSDGGIWVVEASVPEIRRYAPDGTVQTRIGARGEGPGEFMNVQHFGVQGDTIWTFDPMLLRLTLFDREGSVLSTARVEGVPVPLPEGMGYVSPYQMLPGGHFTGHMNRVTYQRNAAPTGVSPTDSIPVPMVLFNAAGEVTDTIGWAGRPPPRLWRPPSDEPDYRMIEFGGRSLMVPMARPTLPDWLPAPDGYVLIETPRAESSGEHVMHVTRIGLEGDTVYSRALPYEPVAFPGAELDSLAARTARGEAGPRRMGAGDPEVPPDWQAAARRLRAEMDFPTYKLPVTSGWLAQDESIWLQRTRLDESVPPESTRWVVLDPEGQLRGELELTPGARPLWHRQDTVWMLEPDEFEVPWVVRYRLEEG